MSNGNSTTPLTAIIIAVSVIIFPDGTVHHFKTIPESQIKENQIYVEKIMSEWYEKNKVRYELRGIDAGQLSTAFATIRMLESDFDKLIVKKEKAK